MLATQRQQRAFDRFVRAQGSPPVTAEGLAEQKRQRVVDLRHQDDVDQAADTERRGAHVRQVRQEEPEIHHADD